MKQSIKKSKYSQVFCAYGQKGLTMIELMIALALSIIVVSGVISMLSHAINSDRLLTSEAEIQETLNYVNNRLSFVFKNSMASPCGNLQEMIAKPSNPNVSKLKRAYYQDGRDGKRPQGIPGIIMGEPDAPYQLTVRQDDFPMFLIGKAGDPNEPKNPGLSSKPFSDQLKGIVPGTEYFISLELSDRILLATDQAGANGNKSVVTGVRGGTDAGPAIKTTGLPERFDNKKNVPFIITDCNQATIFASSDKGMVVMKKSDPNYNVIPVDNNLYFEAAGNGYTDAETIIAPVEMIAYYIQDDNPNDDIPPNLARRDISWDVRTSSEIIAAGIKDMNFEWGLGFSDATQDSTAFRRNAGDRAILSTQVYFTTDELLKAMGGRDPITQGFVSNNLHSIRVTFSATGANDSARYRVGTDPVTGERRNLERRVTRVYTIRNRMARI